MSWELQIRFPFQNTWCPHRKKSLKLRRSEYSIYENNDLKFIDIKSATMIMNMSVNDWKLKLE